MVMNRRYELCAGWLVGAMSLFVVVVVCIIVVVVACRVRKSSCG